MSIRNSVLFFYATQSNSDWLFSAQSKVIDWIMMRRQPFTSRPQPPLSSTIGLNIAAAMFNPVALVRGSCVPGQLLKPIYGCDVTAYQS